jgi:hypothetical protein
VGSGAGARVLCGVRHWEIRGKREAVTQLPQRDKDVQGFSSVLVRMGTYKGIRLSLNELFYLVHLPPSRLPRPRYSMLTRTAMACWATPAQNALF